VPERSATGSQGPPACPATDAHTRRLLWHCRRGMKELDVLLERYVREALNGASPEEWGALDELLALPDPALAGYLLGREVPAEPRMAHLVGRIRTLCRSQDRVGGILPVTPAPDHAELSQELTVYPAHSAAPLRRGVEGAHGRRCK
jgi:antitoxin CptB